MKPSSLPHRKPRKPIQRSTKPLARSGIKRSVKPIPKVNHKRRTREFARCYHSAERVEWVKARPCVFCVLRGLVRIPSESDNAHTERDGLGRKAGYETIAPLCRRHHRMYDEYVKPFDKASVRLTIEIFARQTQLAWSTRTTRET